MSRLCTRIAIVLALAAPPLWAHSSISQKQTDALIEALRLSAPNTARENDGLYSAWQVRAETLSRWSKRCAKREVPPEEFERDETLARSILSCVMGPVLQEQLEKSGGDEALAVRRAAA